MATRHPDAPASLDLTFLDGLRGLAALYVMVGHARWLLWEGYSGGYLSHPQDYAAWEKVLVFFFAAFRYGHEAVLLFFVLSGFVIHLRYSKAIARQGEEASFDWGPYFWRRLRRIYPPYLLALALTVVLDGLGRWLAYPIYERATLYPAINELITNEYAWPNLGFSLVFLSYYFIQVFGSNGALWSLSLEWWFYMVYPLLFLLSRKNRWAPLLLLLVLLVLTSHPEYFGGRSTVRSFFPLLLAWFVGGLMADTYTGRNRIPWRVWMLLALPQAISWVIGLPVTVALAQALSPLVQSWPEYPKVHLTISLYSLSPLLWAGLFAAVIAACFAWQAQGRSLWALTILKPLGDRSYSLYVMHMPLLTLLSGWLMSQNGGHLPDHFGWVGLGIVFSLVLAHLSYLLVEKPFLSKR